MNLLAKLVTPSTVFVLLADHPPLHADKSHPAFDDILQALADADYEALPHLFNVGRAINLKSTEGTLVIDHNRVLIDGEEVHGTIVDRILDKAFNGGDVNSLVKFQRKLVENPSFRIRAQLYEFLERGKQIGISEDGDILAFKVVRQHPTTPHYVNGKPTQFVSIHDGKTLHILGKPTDMDRKNVDDDPANTCSRGLHACSESYLSSFGGSSNDWIIAVRINPKDVVSIPADYNAAKMRCASYVTAAVLGTHAQIVADAPQLDTYDYVVFGIDDGYDDSYRDSRDDYYRD